MTVKASAVSWPVPFVATTSRIPMVIFSLALAVAQICSRTKTTNIKNRQPTPHSSMGESEME
jgi:hypothetical protein